MLDRRTGCVLQKLVVLLEGLNMTFPEITPELLAQAKRNAGGWVYVIDKKYDGSQKVPPEGVVGAWKVDDNGNIDGEFISNSKYAA